MIFETASQVSDMRDPNPVLLIVREMDEMRTSLSVEDQKEVIAQVSFPWLMHCLTQYSKDTAVLQTVMNLISKLIDQNGRRSAYFKGSGLTQHLMKIYGTMHHDCLQDTASVLRCMNEHELAAQLSKYFFSHFMILI